MKIKKSFMFFIMLKIVFITGCSEKKTTENAFLLGTVCSISAYGEDSEQSVYEAFEKVRLIEQKMSLTIESSELNKINTWPINTPVLVSKELFGILKIALEYEKMTDYTFNITLGRLSSLWNINLENPQIPLESDISNALEATGENAFALDEEASTITRYKDITLDLGGIAKGFAADKAVETLKENGIKSAILSFGGNVGTIGTNNGKPWIIGIANPRKTNEIIATIEISDDFVVTSGDYERFFEVDGIRYHHIIDPMTGYPARNGIISATIIADNSTLADALSTAAFILGKEKALDLINSIANVEAILITEDMEIFTSSGIGEYNLEVKPNE